jgi:hypothetical protein
MLPADNIMVYAMVASRPDGDVTFSRRFNPAGSSNKCSGGDWR